jgi:hypothetical protein
MRNGSGELTAPFMGLREAYKRKKVLKRFLKRNQDLCRAASHARLNLQTLSKTLR